MPPRVTLATLGARLREKRGARRLRDVAKEIGISAATLMRVENGRAPDLGTFAKICKWLGIDPRPLLGLESDVKAREDPPAYEVSAHLRLDQNPNPKTVQALAKMILHAAKLRPTSQDVPDDGDA